MNPLVKQLANHPLTRNLCCKVEDHLHTRRYLGTAALRQRALESLAACNDTASNMLFAQAHSLGATQIIAEINSLMQLANSRQTRAVVDIGTARGGTTFLFGRLLQSLELLVTVDLMPRHTRLLRALFPHRIQFHAIRGSSYAPETVGRVRRRLGDRKIDLLFIDGDHRYAGVAADLAQYAPLVAPEGLIAVHDIVPTRQAGDPIKTQRWVGGVPQFWQELRSNASEHWEFVADHNQEGFGIGVVCKRGLRPCGAIS